VRTIALEFCTIEIDDRSDWLRTVFYDGSEVSAAPVFPDQLPTARRLGYRGDDVAAVRALWLAHDTLHSILAEVRGEGVSIGLWSVAHSWRPCPATWLEESRVLALQAHLNGVAALPPDVTPAQADAVRARLAATVGALRGD
jgi:hypothetical protein